MPCLPPPPAGRSWSARLLLLVCVGLIAVFAFAVGREFRPPAGRAPAEWFSPAAAWSGVWLKKKESGGFELPAVEWRKESAGVAGRYITAGPDPEHDYAQPCEEVNFSDDEVTFVTTAGGRVKHRMKQTGPDTGELFVIPDPDHALTDYLDQSGRGDKRTLSAEKRTQAFHMFGSPDAPRRIGQFVRVATRTPSALRR